MGLRASIRVVRLLWSVEWIGFPGEGGSVVDTG